MSIYSHRVLNLLALSVFATSITISAAQADDDDDEGHGENRGKPARSAQSNTKFQQECAACHIAYAPGLLPAASWRKVMAGLDKHFGSDASLDAKDNKEITAFLVNNASNRRSSSDAPLRITETAWFKRQHDAHEINPKVWKNPKVKSPANCSACHPQAERGYFDEDDIKIPR